MNNMAAIASYESLLLLSLFSNSLLKRETQIPIKNTGRYTPKTVLMDGRTSENHENILEDNII
jgi:hypothetical protein